MGLAAWWDRHAVPRLVKLACSSPQIEDVRREIVPRAKGRLFEIGCGGGINQPLYRRAQITHYAGIDPGEKLLGYARAEAEKQGWQADIRAGIGEDIPFEDESFDTVVCTYTLCSVQDEMQTLSELRRILKPGGTLLYLEHGRAPDPKVAKWQERIEPAWKPLLGGCHLTRPITSNVERAGFSTTKLGERYLPRMPRFAGWNEWGEAVKTG